MEQDIISNYNCPVKTEYCLKHSISYRGKCPMCYEEEKMEAMRSKIKQSENDSTITRLNATKYNRVNRISHFIPSNKEVYTIMDIVDYCIWNGYTREERLRTIKDLLNIFEIKTSKTRDNCTTKIIVSRDEYLRLISLIKEEQKKSKQVKSVDKSKTNQE